MSFFSLLIFKNDEHRLFSHHSTPTPTTPAPFIYAMPLSYYHAPQQSHQSCWQKWDSSPSCHQWIPPVCRQGRIRESRLYSLPAFRNHYSIGIEDAFPAVSPFSCGRSPLFWSRSLPRLPASQPSADIQVIKAICGTFKVPRVAKFHFDLPVNSSGNKKSLSIIDFLAPAIGNRALKCATMDSALSDVTKCSAVWQRRLMKLHVVVWKAETSPGDPRYMISQK